MSLAYVLMINCGSSSMKFSVIPQDADQPLLSGLTERPGIDHAIIAFKDQDDYKSTVVLDGASHQHAFKMPFAKLDKQQLLEAINAVGHRVAHGGNGFKKSVLVTGDVIEKVRTLSVLAPLHDPANLIGIGAAQALLPALPHIAMFDTAFHQTLSPTVYTYAISLEFRQGYMVRRYGFRGASHHYITAETLASLNLDLADHGIVIAHLGNGSSLCTVQNGTSVDTSMGMAPLEGLVIGMHCGDLDFGVVAYLAKRTGRTFDTLYKMLNNQSGLMGISGSSSDYRTLQQARDEGRGRAALAIDVLVHHLARRVGSHVTSLKRFDALIFAGGVGENSALIREFTVQHLQVLGLELDKERNQQLFDGRNGLISKTDTAKIVVTPTSEGKMIAIDVAEIARTA